MDSENLFLLVGNGPYSNRGCEAIIRGTVKILKASFSESKFYNYNFKYAQQINTTSETDMCISHKEIIVAAKGTSRWLANQITRRISRPLYLSLQFGAIKKQLKECRAALSIGGDNYTLDYGIPRRFIDLNDYVTSYNKPLIIWGASLGPFDHMPNFANIIHSHLKNKVTAIFVREKRSFEYLKKHGIVDNVYLTVDPAFVMDYTPVTEEALGFTLPQGTIGLNLSPLLGKRIFGNNINDWHDYCLKIINKLKDTFDRPILLIPHVTTLYDNDYNLLQRLRDLNKKINNVFLLPGNLTAEQTKWVISQLDCLIAARTHATIASLSSCVPTISLAYSVKAWGINEMIFNHADFVVDLTQDSLNELLTKVQFVIDNSSNIRSHLNSTIPILQKQAMDSGLKLKEIICDCRY